MSTQKHKHHGDVNTPHANKPSDETDHPGFAVRAAVDSENSGRAVVPSGNQEQSDSCVRAESLSDQDQPVQGNASEVATIKAELLGVREEFAALSDKYLRKLAEEVNFRKRMARDKDDARRFAINGFLGDIVPVLDDFDRALSGSTNSNSAGNGSVGTTSGEIGHLRDGVILIRRQLGQMLENKYGLKRMASIDQPFDPNLHEAVGMEMGDTEEPVVCEEYLPGYVVEERVVRTAKVKVRMPAPKTAQSSDGGSESGADSADASDEAGSR